MESLKRWILIAGICWMGGMSLTGDVLAQELREEPTPFTTWLDFARRSREGWPKSGLPIWMESVSASNQIIQGEAKVTVFRIRLQDMREFDTQMEMRLFFDDSQDAQPTVTGWSETGTQIFTHGPLGQKLGLSTSEALTFPTANLDYIEITVKGDGQSVRGAFFELLQTTEVLQALDFAVPSRLIEAFERAAPLLPPPDDMVLFGRVRATLDREASKLTPQETPTNAWEFELSALPLAAVISFEILGADIEAPLEVTVNDRPLGTIAVALPDLADPAYVGLVRHLQS